jgi:hypothetical protein
VARGSLAGAQGGGALMRARVALALSAFVAMAVPSAVLAATPAITAQAQAADAAFLAYAPAPAGGSGALCLVDTGVHANADTTPGLVSATALDGGSGEDVDPQGHGTRMAMVAGAAGSGLVGAWPQLRVVSVRATTQPPPGQEPTFEFNNYAEGIEHCLQQQGRYAIHAVDLALSSTIPPSPDESQTLQSAIAQADAKNMAIVAAAGNAPGAVEEPGAQPGILAVGAFTAQPDGTSATPTGSVCSFSANAVLTLFGPGCGIDEADPFTDQPTCCGNGTSQASAFVSAVLVALMSYDPSIGYTRAEELLVSTATDGDLNVAAAFNAAGLGSIVAAGNANLPKAPAPAATPPTNSSAKVPGAVSLRRLRWHRGVLEIRVAPLPKGARLHIWLRFAHRVRFAVSSRPRLRLRTRRPRVVQLRLQLGKEFGPMRKIKLKR